MSKETDLASQFNSGENVIALSCISTHKKYGTWWAVGTEKEWIELRTTKAGKIKVLRQEKGKHPYFTVKVR